MNIDQSIRSILLKNAARTLIKQIDSNQIKSGNKFKIYLKEVNNCLHEAYPNQELHFADSEAYKKTIDDCYINDETKLLKLLKKHNIIRMEYPSNEDDSCIAEIEITNKKGFRKMALWANNHKYIITYGSFALNQLTGEAYFKNKLYLFKPGSGQYDLFKEFLKRESHFLTYEEIVSIQQQENKITNKSHKDNEYVFNEHNNEELRSAAKERIGYLKRVMKMRDGFGKLFKTVEKRGFTLLPQLIR